jgi:hypothetical protein
LRPYQKGSILGGGKGGVGTFSWDRHYAELINLTGWTWEYIDACMTLPRLYAMHESWQTIPPPAIQLARIATFLGIAPKEEVEPEQVGTIDDFVKMMGGLPNG